MKKNESIESLLAIDPKNVAAPALKLALEQHRKEQEQREAEQALCYLRSVEHHVEEAVSILRDARRVERMAKERLEKVVAARDEFHKTGNWENFVKAIR